MLKRTYIAGVLLSVVAVACFMPTPQAQSADAAVIARFVGTWKEDVAKRNTAAMGHLRFQQNASGGLEEARGPEEKPLLQPVIFDGKPHEVPGGGNQNRLAWKQIDPSTFERVLSEPTGKVLSTRRLRIAADGQRLTEEFTIHEGPQPTSTVVFQRVSGGPEGLIGRWKPQSFKTTAPPVERFEQVGTNGLKFYWPR